MKKFAALLLLLCPVSMFAQAPANDLCQGAITIPPGGGLIAGTNVSATASIFGVGSCGLQGADVWYKYVGTTTGNKLVASLCPPGSATFNCGVDILTGSSCFSLLTSACTTAWCVNGTVTTGRAVATMTAGANYFIRVKDPAGGTGTFNLYVADIPAGAQPNGTCATAQAVSNGINANKSNFGEPAALQAGFTPCVTAGKDVFFSYLATGTGGTLVRTCLPSVAPVPALSIHDSVIAVYSSCAGGSPIACSATGCGGVPGSGSNLSTLTFPSVAGTTYLIQVAGVGSGAAATEGNFDLEIIPPPANDECIGAIPLTAGSNGPFGNTNASTSVGYTGSCSPGYNDVFYSYTPSSTTVTTIDTGCAGFDTVLSVWSGCGGTQLACNDNAAGACSPSSAVVVIMNAGQNYIIRVASAFSTAYGSFMVNITPGPPPLVNDECVGAGAALLSNGANGPFTNSNSTTSAGYSGSCSTGYNDLFYAYVPSCSSFTTIDTGCAGFDTVLSVWSSCGGTQLACNDNATGACSPSSSVTLAVTAGQTYIIRVASASAIAFGSYTINITPSFGLNWTSPFGPGTLQFQVCNGLPNGVYYLFASLAVATPPGSGWFYGLNMTLGDIQTQINQGWPFNGPLNAVGSYTSPVFGLPSGLAFDTVAFSVAPGSTTPVGNSGPKTYVIP